MATLWTNPWIDAVPVPVEELAQALITPDRSAEMCLCIWTTFGNQLDAYILPKKALPFYSVGVRYGEDGHKYLSPDASACTAEIEQLLAKYA